MTDVQMVDLKGQYDRISQEIDDAVLSTIRSANFINGPEVVLFQKNLENYLGVEHVIPCANGTDALLVALMALDLSPGDEVIVPAFTYVATAEVVALLGLKPVLAEVDESTFNISISSIESLICEKTKVIVPVHLYGQSADMEPIMMIAKKWGIYVIEDNAQAIGSVYTFSDGTQKKAGTIGHIGTTSFFPSKNLGCYGDGGAIMTRDSNLATKIRMIVNHGQKQKYHHELAGVNSRLDTIQAAILDVKLKYLDRYNSSRKEMAEFYNSALKDINQLVLPESAQNSSHVYHQYTIKVKDGERDSLKQYLYERGVQSMIYYPIPLYRQVAFKNYVQSDFVLPITEELCKVVLSLPIHSEPKIDELIYTVNSIRDYFGK